MSCPGTTDSMLLQVDIGGASGQPALSPIVHPLKIDLHHRPVLCDAVTAERQRQNIEQLSRQLLDPAAVRAVWRSTCWQQVYGNIFGTYYTWRKKGLAAAIKHDIAIVRTAEHRRWMYGFLSAGFQ